MLIARVVSLTFFLLLFLSSVSAANVINRCSTYTQEVRTAHAFYFGLDFPWWYGVAQLQKESNCRDIISRDGVGSEGAPQITYRWWADKLSTQGIFDVKTRKNQLRAQAFINHDAYKKTFKYDKKLWIMFQIYNGGTLVLREIDRAGIIDHSAARSKCQRKNITFNNGQVRNACDINYEYSVILYRYANNYRVGKDNNSFEFW